MALQSDKLRLLRRIPEIRFEEELRGYSKQQVDRVLENLAPLADEIEALQNRLAEAETRAASAEARLIEHGGREADLAPIAPPAAAPLPATPVDFDETLRNTLLLAQRTADETVRRANDDAARITGSAATEAEQTLAAARAEAAQLDADIHARRAELLADVDAERNEMLGEIKAAAEARRQAIEAELTQTEGAERAELLSQIEDLQGIRAMLVEDVELLERHLDVRREAVRSVVAEISAVIDEPQRLRADGPGLASIPEVSMESIGSSEVRLTAPLLDELATERSAADVPAGSAHESAFVDDLREPAVDEFVLDPSADSFLAAPVFADPDLATQEVSAVRVAEIRPESDVRPSDFGAFTDQVAEDAGILAFDGAGPDNTGFEQQQVSTAQVSRTPISTTGPARPRSTRTRSPMAIVIPRRRRSRSGARPGPTRCPTPRTRPLPCWGYPSPPQWPRRWQPPERTHRRPRCKTHSSTSYAGQPARASGLMTTRSIVSSRATPMLTAAVAAGSAGGSSARRPAQQSGQPNRLTSTKRGCPSTR